jgi:ribosomal protein S18 acetylase RimI-like enzyme
MEFRALAADDAAAWWDLRLAALESEPLAYGTSAEEHRATTIADAVTRIANLTDGSFLLGGWDLGKLVGMATFFRETGSKERHKGHIYGVYVAASHRGFGLGVRLLAELLDRVRCDPTIEQVLLGVGTHNTAAIRTYQRLGFEIYGTEPRALKVGAQTVDEHQMILRLGTPG